MRERLATAAADAARAAARAEDGERRVAQLESLREHELALRARWEGGGAEREKGAFKPFMWSD